MPQSLADALPPPATFAPELHLLPPTELAGRRLPRLGPRLHVGLGTWNSRGVNFVSALRAMLGDPSIHVESPHFTLRRLQLRYGTHGARLDAALDEHIYRSSSTPDWGGIRQFRSLASHVNASAELERVLYHVRRRSTESAAYLDRLRSICGQSEAAASALARVLLDSLFADGPFRLEQLDTLVQYQDVVQEMPVDALVVWSLVDPQPTACYYGRESTIVLSTTQPEARGVDLNYLSAMMRRGYSLTAGPTGDMGEVSCGDLMNGTQHLRFKGDLGQVATPGYHRGSDIIRFELRRDARRACRTCTREVADGKLYRARPIELAFHRSEARSTGAPVILVVMPREKQPTDCIVDEADGKLYPCRRFSRGNCTSIPEAPRSQADAAPLPVVAAVFVAPDAEGGATSANLIACNGARDVLLRSLSNEIKRDRSLQAYPRILAAVQSIRLGCTHGHTLVIAPAEQCEEVLAESTRVRFRIPTRFGWEGGEWRGDVPSNWRIDNETHRELVELCPEEPPRQLLRGKSRTLDSPRQKTLKPLHQPIPLHLSSADSLPSELPPPRQLVSSCWTALGGAVHIMMLARGSTLLHSVLATAANVQLWSDAPWRLCFHVLAGEVALRDHQESPSAVLELVSQLQFAAGRGDVVRVYNATDGAWEQALTANALRWLHHPALKQSPQAHACTVAKLFAHELLPAAITQVMVLDSDLYFMADVVQLWEWFEQETARLHTAALAYAPESQNIR
ncbi:hypothetical protein AB1Y20_017828 [Prymnesium parvum]|uniref:Uncharacterized protein n=1 Tax=Prymnesium parvum TaxID=97485 RepID=A0AB34JQ79_PRYPA